MGDLSRGLSREQLERLLNAVRDDLVFPAAPDLAAATRVRLNEPPAVGAARWGALGWSPGVTLGGVIMAAVLAAVLALAVSSSARAVFHDAVEGVDFDFVDSGNESAETPDALAAQLGSRVTFDEAQEAVEFDIVFPSELGAPDEVYLNSSLPGGVVTLLYYPDGDLPEVDGFGLLVTQFSGETVKVKEIPPGTSVEDVLVEGLPGYWIAGPHTISYRDAAGQDASTAFRRSGESLVWEREGVTIRVESTLGRDGSIELAETIE
jgi:hypothetical protein